MKIGSFKTKVPAKINLWLQIVGKRSDGYHNLWSLMLPVSVFDEMKVTISEGKGIEIRCTDFNIPTNSSNTIWRAIKAYEDATKPLKYKITVQLKKNIPVGAGLGGGSADAGFLLRGLNDWAQNSVSSEELLKIARKVGADVPFFVYSRPSLASGIGDILKLVDGLPSYPLLLIKPPVALSTREIYQSLELTKKSQFISINALEANPWNLGKVVVNDLEAAAVKRCPSIGELKQWLLDVGAVAAGMSGSGPTVFGVFRDGKEVEIVKEKARSRWGSGYWIESAEVLTEGSRVVLFE